MATGAVPVAVSAAASEAVRDASPASNGHGAPGPADPAPASSDSSALHRWIECIGIVQFDLELGQVLEATYPRTEMDPDDALNVCFAAFPDSNSGSLGDHVFSFRIRRTPHAAPGPTTPRGFASDAEVEAARDSAKGKSRSGLAKLLPSGSRSKSLAVVEGANGPYRTSSERRVVGKTPQQNSEFVYGYVFFRQERDTNAERGYMQKSVVVLSKHCFVGLFEKVVSLIGPLYFQHGDTLLEAACKNIEMWPDPVPDTQLEVPILGTVLSAYLPDSHGRPFQVQLIEPEAGKRPHSLKIDVTAEDAMRTYACDDQFQGVDLWSTFAGVLPFMWHIWELVLTGQPLLVIGPDPAQSSRAVLGMVSLIMPLRFFGDYRPYFTIHDSDFKFYTTKRQDNSLPSCILGVTNPFFSKALAHWPHTLTIGAKRVHDNDLIAAHHAKSERGDQKQRLATKKKPLLTADKDLLHRITKAGTSSKAPPLTPLQADRLLRHHFAQLSNAFLAPLERYFATLMPLARTVVPFYRAPTLKPFSEKAFLRGVEKSELKLQFSNLGSRGNWVELYRRFVHCPNFRGWYKMRRKEALAELRRVYRQAVLTADPAALLANKKEVEIVDLYLRVKNELSQEQNSPAAEDTSAMLSQLERCMTAIMNALPEDLQLSLRANPDSMFS